MAQRNSEYARMPGDCYVTPGWVWNALYEVEPWAKTAWDPAPVDGDFDFLEDDLSIYVGLNIASNPPFKLADKFIRHSLLMTETHNGKVAMLLPHTFDTARTRTPLGSTPYKCKYVLTRRIRWDNLDQKKAGPSTNHAWYVWDWKYKPGWPSMRWL